ncbi:hypothetical protein [Streptomyces sp. NPDC000878]
MRPDELNAPERQLWDSFSQGRTVDVRDAPASARAEEADEEEEAVRADVVAALLLGAGPENAPGDRPALRLTGARITGRLDLRFAEIAVPVVLTDCRFDEAPHLQGARTRELVMTDCGLPGLVADTAQIDARLVLSRCRLTGPLVLTRAQINGDLDLRDTTITAPGGEAISAARATVSGDALCVNLTVDGGFRLSGASIDGEFALDGAALRNPGGHALDAYHVRITEDFTFHPGFSAEGRIILSGATVGAGLGFCGARLSNAGDIALEAIDVTVSRNIDLGRGLTVEGGIKLDGTRIGTELSFRDATLTHPDGTALSLRARPRPGRPTCAPGAPSTARSTHATPTWARCATPRTPGPPTSAWPRRRTTPSRSPSRQPRESTGSDAPATATCPSRTSNWPRPTGNWGTRTKRARYCSPDSATVARPSPRTSASGGTSRTRPSATATAPSAPDSGCWPCSSAARCTSARIPRPRSKRARHRSSTPSSTPSIYWYRSSPSARKPPSPPGTAASGLTTH